MKTIISTGLRGASQGAVGAAFINEIAVDGYCPKGFILPTGKQPELASMGLKEHESDSVVECFEDNMNASDGTIFFFMESLVDQLDKELMDIVEASNTPSLLIDLDSPLDVRIVEKFIQKNDIETLHVDGCQDSPHDKTIYKFVCGYVTKVVKNLKHEALFEH
jgi:hypothetical protein